MNLLNRLKMDNSKFEIVVESDIPIPDTTAMSEKVKKTLEKMNIGESFQYPSTMHSVVYNQVNNLKSRMRFSTRKDGQGFRRVWRTQ